MKGPVREMLYIFRSLNTSSVHERGENSHRSLGTCPHLSRYLRGPFTWSRGAETEPGLPKSSSIELDEINLREGKSLNCRILSQIQQDLLIFKTDLLEPSNSLRGLESCRPS